MKCILIWLSCWGYRTRKYPSGQRVRSPQLQRKNSSRNNGWKTGKWLSLKRKQWFLLPWPWISKSQAVLGGAHRQRRPEVLYARSPAELWAPSPLPRFCEDETEPTGLENKTTASESAYLVANYLCLFPSCDLQAFGRHVKNQSLVLARLWGMKWRVMGPDLGRVQYMGGRNEWGQSPQGKV